MRRVFIDRCLKSVFVLLVGAGSLAASAQEAPSAQDTVRLSLDQALEIALSESPTVKIADMEITKQDYTNKGNYSSLFPQVDFSAGYQRTIKKQRMYMDFDMPGTGDASSSADASSASEGFEVGRDNNWSLGFTASMPIVSVGLWKSLSISEDDVDLAIEKARSSRISMIQQVKQAYYGVLLAEDAYNVYKQTYDNAVINYNDIKGNYEQGRVSEYDLIRANVTVKNLEPNVYDAQNAIILATWKLKALLGMDLDLIVKCEGNLVDYEQELKMEVEYKDFSLENNSTIRQLEIQNRQLLKMKQMQIAEYYPTLNAQFSYQWISMNNNFIMKDYRWDPYSVVGLSLNIPIFSGGKRFNNVRSAKISMEQLNWQKEDTERNLRVAAKQSIDQMNICLKQYEAALEGASEAQKGYDISVKRYETGKGTILEINDSRLSLTQAQLNLSQSIYNYLNAKAVLESTLGMENLPYKNNQDE